MIAVLGVEIDVMYVEAGAERDQIHDVQFWVRCTRSDLNIPFLHTPSHRRNR